MTQSAIHVEGLTKMFKRKQVIDRLTFSVEPGSFNAYLGPNGAGKTTTIRLLLDLLRADGGTCRVLNLNPATEGTEIRRRTGYVPERPKMIGWMTVNQLISFTANFYPTWDSRYTDELLNRFNLQLQSKVKHLSRGEEAKLALLLALSHHPEILILDDATAGIDAAARRDILEGIIAHVHDQGATIFFATHLVHEIEGLADQVIILGQSRILEDCSLTTLKSNYKKVVIWGSDGQPVPPASAQILTQTTSGRAFEFITSNFKPNHWTPLASGCSMEIEDLSLEDIFVALQKNRGGVP